MRRSALMVQGTASDVGKTLFVTGLCRILARRGISVAPFKPQNMSLNSAVTRDGGEIGRGQALQAFAAGVDPVTDMNPILLKPTTDTGAQVIVNGRAIGVMNAATYHTRKPTMKKEALAAFYRLENRYDVVLVEGAGSPAEINLRDNDIANMGFAEEADLPVWLVADIERGGVFAQIVGTIELLSPAERKRVIGVAINRFRGEVALLKPGLDWLKKEKGVPLIGVMPHLRNLRLDAEDSLSRREESSLSVEGELRVAIPLLPHISNHTDFEPLVDHPQVAVTFVQGGEPFPPADLVIVPGSKNAIADCEWLRDEGFDQAICRHLRYGGKALGICGGYQILGGEIHDPQGVEGAGRSCRGLALLEVETLLVPEKKLASVQGKLCLGGARVSGYEIHSGQTTGPARERPFCHLANRPEGAWSLDRQVAGTYLHGLFDEGEALMALLRWAGLSSPVRVDRARERMVEIDRLADAMENNLDLEWFWRTVGR